MEKRQKKYYEAPSTMVFDIRQESVICASDPSYNGFGVEENMSFTMQFEDDLPMINF